MKHPQELDNPVSCPRCGIGHDFVTDSIGRLIAVHGIGKCIPGPLPVYEKDDDDKASERRCIECHRLFVPGRKRSNAHVCSSECRQVRRARYHKLWVALYGKAAAW